MIVSRVSFAKEGSQKPEISGVVNDKGESGGEDDSITERHEV